MSSPIHEHYMGVLRRHLRFVGEQEPIPPERTLVEVGLDSIGTINLLLDLEESFGVSFPGALLTAETFRTAGSLEEAVSSLVGGAA
jgi:acyl carrier protein